MPKSVPELSIITPNFNCLPYLDAWLNSILQQSYNEYEIIVVDDGSNDGSKTWLSEKEEQLECLTVIYENKLGPGGARNTAAQIARGRYLAFLDADDAWLPGKLEQQMRFHKNNPDVVLSFTDYEHIKEDTGDAIIGCFDYWPLFRKTNQLESIELQGYQILTNALAQLFSENVVGTSTTLVARSAFLAVGGFDTALKSASDWDLWLKLAALGDVGFTMEKTMLYLMRSGSVSSNIKNRIAAMESITARHVTHAATQDHHVKRIAQARISVAKAEYCDSRQNQWGKFLYSCKAFMEQPCERYFKEMIKAVLMLPEPLLKHKQAQ